MKKPYGFIQWKGTDVCMDIHCICGAHEHYDGDFLYYYKCKTCGRIFEVGSSVPLKELSVQEQKELDIKEMIK